MNKCTVHDAWAVWQIQRDWHKCPGKISETRNKVTARHLQRERVLLHVLVEIRQIVVRDHRLKVGGQAELLAERGGQRRLAGADEARDADEDLRACGSSNMTGW